MAEGVGMSVAAVVAAIAGQGAIVATGLEADAVTLVAPAGVAIRATGVPEGVATVVARAIQLAAPVEGGRSPAGAAAIMAVSAVVSPGLSGQRAGSQQAAGDETQDGEQRAAHG
ncbi:hypothetical protein D3C85_1634280 [compost metagenome]